MKSDRSLSIPDNFRYLEAFIRGRPRHQEYDEFWCRHPAMESGHRAKLFSPFDALKGFDEEIQAQEERFSDPFPPDGEDEIP